MYVYIQGGNGSSAQLLVAPKYVLILKNIWGAWRGQQNWQYIRFFTFWIDLIMIRSAKRTWNVLKKSTIRNFFDKYTFLRRYPVIYTISVTFNKNKFVHLYTQHFIRIIICIVEFGAWLCIWAIRRKKKH